MQLHNMLSGAGILFLVIGMAAADSELIAVPVMGIMLGIVLLGIGIKESGEMKKPSRSCNSIRGQK